VDDSFSSDGPLGVTETGQEWTRLQPANALILDEQEWNEADMNGALAMVECTRAPLPDYLALAVFCGLGLVVAGLAGLAVASLIIKAIVRKS
jgi:hypothetical protein